MKRTQLISRLRSLVAEELPLPGAGATPLRHQRLMEIGREDLALTRLSEAHWDAVAILAEAGRRPEPNQLYGVWASEKPGEALELRSSTSGGMTLRGSKMFCSGAGLVDHVLVTVGVPKNSLVDVDLRRNAATSGFKGLVKFHGASIDVPDGRMDRIPPTCSGLRHFLMVRRANSILYPITVMNPRNRLHFRDRLGSPPFAKNRQCVIRRKSMLETRVGLLATTEVWSSHRVGEPPRSSSARYISTHDVPRLETASERPWP